MTFSLTSLSLGAEHSVCFGFSVDEILRVHSMIAPMLYMFIPNTLLLFVLKHEMGIYQVAERKESLHCYKEFANRKKKTLFTEEFYRIFLCVAPLILFFTSFMKSQI